MVASVFQSALQLAGFLASGSLLTLGAIIAADELPVDVPGALGTGAVILTLGVILFRLVLQASRHNVDVSADLERRLLARVEDLEADLTAERQRSGRLLVAWEAERAARIRASSLLSDVTDPTGDLAAIIDLADRLGVQVHPTDAPRR